MRVLVLVLAAGLAVVLAAGIAAGAGVAVVELTVAFLGPGCIAVEMRLCK